MAEPSGAIAIVAEKPSVARDIARVVGAGRKGEGYLHGNGYIVTWAVGHLVRLAQPHEIRPEWKVWRRDLLPMLPSKWPLVVIDQTSGQFDIIRRILTSPKVARAICATDAGREGELIFRYIYEAAASEKPVSRLWVSSLTPDAIRNGLDGARDWSQYDSLAAAARGRSRADWLVGMNLSRAYTLACNEQFSVGRVQTPTLAMLVQRELEIRAFVPEDYMEVQATFSPAPGSEYQGTWFREGVEPLQAATRLPVNGEAKAIVERARSGEAKVESVKAETERMPPPLLYDLTELQRHANRLYGFSAQKTLELAQSLYETRKLLSYPRTDSRHLSGEVARTLPRIVAAIRDAYADTLAAGTGEKPLGRRFVDDAKVTDHHAIIPTHVKADRSTLSADEARIYDMVCRRLLSGWHADYVTSVTTVVTAIANDKYHTSGTTVQQAGWKVLDIVSRQKEEERTLPPLSPGQPVTVVDAEALRKKTRPPKRFTEGTLLTAMETAGKTLDEKELSDAMKECGLGTPATRAATIELLLQREYIERQKKSLVATEKGIRLIEIVHPEVKSPAMTGQWEAFLQRIHRGEAALEPFLEGIERYVREVVGKVRGAGSQPAAASQAAPARRAEGPPQAKGLPHEILKSTFGFECFRPNQEAVCRALIAGEDALLVMPTGSGKSLCYQLPGVARGGTTLVISPLISLIEDQVAALRAKGFAAERIHSGRDRAASRRVCTEYLDGRFQFLFVAPERLRVQGFPEMLAKRKPALVAIDEAHCISQWGHDFRPDYRRIGPHLPGYRPAPVIALTAPATAVEQDDIVAQLGLPHAKRFIHGFRRDNIAIEVVEVAQGARLDMVREILAQPGRRPAIVYTPTRREAESVAHALGAAPYHAGMDAKRRDEVQAAFIGDQVDAIVATIAFGMGIDKPDVRTVIHTGLPGSLEGYYQEIGRAGRDGAPSRAILMQAYSDRRTHDYFFERDYPDPSVLAAIFKSLSAEPLQRDDVMKATRMDEESFDVALEKLAIHGGALVDAADTLTRGTEEWRASYEAQCERKQAQLRDVLRFTECNQCRMVKLVRHFGDRAGAREPCGICDYCAGGDAIAQQFRPADPFEQRLAREIINALRAAGTTSSGRLFTQVGAGLERYTFERLLAGLARAGFIEMADAVFEKDGREIPYKRVSVTSAGRALDQESAVEFDVTTGVAAPPKPRKPRKKSRRKARRANG